MPPAAADATDSAPSGQADRSRGDADGSEESPDGSPGQADWSEESADGSQGQADASARWRALGTLVQLVVTDPRCLAEARRLLTADLAEVDAACSRFRADSEILALRSAR